MPEAKSSLRLIFSSGLKLNLGFDFRDLHFYMESSIDGWMSGCSGSRKRYKNM